MLLYSNQLKQIQNVERLVDARSQAKTEGESKQAAKPERWLHEQRKLYKAHESGAGLLRRAHGPVPAALEGQGT